MADSKLIAVVGATGQQGGGLVRAALAAPGAEFRIRALTRNPDSGPARELSALGADVVRADLDQADTLRAAFHGVDGAFLVTNFWEYLSPEREVAQARNMAEATKETGVGHVVWSTLEDMREWVPLSDERMPTLMDRYKVPHYDGKGEADKIFKEVGAPTTFFRTSFYWDNMIHFGMGPKAGDDGVLTLTFPMDGAKLPGMAAEDIGKCALGVLRRADEFIDRTIGVVGEFLTGEELARGLSDALGREVRYNAVEPDVYRSFGFPGADDLGNMFQVKRDFNDAYCANRDIALSRELNPELQTFREWADRNKDRIPLD